MLKAYGYQNLTIEFSSLSTKHAIFSIKGELSLPSLSLKLNVPTACLTYSFKDTKEGELQVKIKEDAELSIPALKLELKKISISAIFLYSPNKSTTLRLESLTGSTFGGEVMLNPTTIHFGNPLWNTELLLQNVGLNNLMQLYPNEKIEVSGSINGNLPIKHNKQGLLIENGSITATTPGRIQLHGVVPEGFAHQSLGVLEDYHYTSLSAGISGNPLGKLSIALHLSGSNPDWQQGQSVNLNMNISEDIASLMRSIELTTGKQ